MCKAEQESFDYIKTHGSAESMPFLITIDT